MLCTRDSLQMLGHIQVKSERIGKGRNHFHRNLKKIGVAIHRSVKIDLKTKEITRDKKEHYMVTKRPIYQKD